MSDIVQSVDRTFSILELVAEYEEGLGITEISAGTDLHKSTVHRLLGTLIYRGYIVQDPISNRYRISLKLYELGVKKIESMDILKVSKPYTEELMKKINEVVHLVIRDGVDIVYIDKVEADNTIRMDSTVGRRSQLYSTSVGKAMMSSMDEDEVEEIWKNSNIVELTPNTITDLASFKEELKRIGQLGYAEDDEENELGVRCIGSPVFNHKGEIEGAISISGPTIRVTKDKVDLIGKEVRKYAMKISRELGYRDR